MTDTRYVLGLDLGQASDPTVAALIEYDVTPLPEYCVRGLHRYPLGSSYPDIVEDITHRLRQPPLASRTQLAVDATGVGAPVIDLFRKQQPRPAQISAITITAGSTVNRNHDDYTVPKTDLITNTTVLLQKQKIRIAKRLTHRETLANELRSYRVHINDAGHPTYRPARASDHDDFVVALSLALWLAEKRPYRPATILISRRTDQLLPIRGGVYPSRPDDPWLYLP